METYLSRRRRELRSRRYEKVWQKLHFALEYLSQEGATEIYLFGSITNPEKFTEHSDVDLAVKGFTAEKHLEIEGKLEDIFHEVEFDILFLDGEAYLREEIADRIKQEAVLWRPSS